MRIALFVGLGFCVGILPAPLAAAPEPEPVPHQDAPEHAPERSFSLFSWIRRPPTE